MVPTGSARNPAAAGVLAAMAGSPMQGGWPHLGHLSLAHGIHTSGFPQGPPDFQPNIRRRCGIPTNLKVLAMTPKFLREEASRFRGMAETAEREASKQRFLMMAADFEARAQAADELTEPTVSEGVAVVAGKRAAKAPG
jgi:hypothetical protein